MKLEKLIEKVTVIKGQQYDIESITAWINEIEGQVIDFMNSLQNTDIPFIPYDYKTDLDRELQLPDRFQDIYIDYVCSKIEFFNQETERYNNTVVMFDAAYNSFEAWIKKKNRQKAQIYFSKF